MAPLLTHLPNYAPKNQEILKHISSLVDKQVSQFERLAIEFSTIRKCMLNNDCFNTSEKRCNLIDSSNASWKESNIERKNFQGNILLMRVIKYLLESSFNLKVYNYETMVEIPELYSKQIHDLICFTNGSWDCVKSVQFLFVIDYAKAKSTSNKKRISKENRKFKEAVGFEPRDIRNIGIIAIKKLEYLDGLHINYLYSNLPHPKTGLTGSSHLSCLCDQVMVVICSLLYPKVHKSTSLCNVNYPGDISVKKHVLELGFRDQLMSHISSNVKMHDLTCFTIHELVDKKAWDYEFVALEKKSKVNIIIRKY